MKKEQRVVDLSKIDTAEMAYIAGFQCRNWNTHFGWYKNEKNLVDLCELPIFRYFRDDENDIWHQFILNNFVTTFDEIHINNELYQKYLNKGIKKEDLCTKTKWKRALNSIHIHLKITEKSKTFIGNKLPTVKKEFYPYLLFGLYHSTGYVNCDNTIHIFNNINIIKNLYKQLVNWYDFDEKFLNFDDKYGYHFGLLSISEYNINKFINILPKDYLNLFDDSKIKKLI